jgi:hypothetical protein
MNYWIEILQIIVICFVLSDMANFISELFYELLVETKNKVLKLILSFFTYILSCPKCFTFHFTLIFTFDLFAACIAALAINIIKSIEYKLTKKETEL